MSAELLGRFLQARIADGWIPGARWIVWRDGETIAEGTAGLAALEPERRALEPETPFDLASLTKPLVTAPLALSLLELDAAVGEWIDLGRWSGATPRELATHTSGLPAWRPLYREAEGLEGFLAAIASVEPAAPRGSVLYSDLGYLLLGALCERAGRAPLDRQFRRALAAPLGLRCAFPSAEDRFADAAAVERSDLFESRLAGGAARPLRPTIAAGEVHDGNAYALGGVAGHAGLFGPAVDVVRLARHLVHPRGEAGLRLKGEARRAFLEPGPGGRSAGWERAAASRAVTGLLPDRYLGHLGFTGGSIWLDPELDSGALLLTHRVHPVVSPRDFARLRRAFHRLAAPLLAAG